MTRRDEIERATHSGVINQMVDTDSLQAATLDAAHLIARKAPLAIQAIKEQLRVLEDFQPMPVHAMERMGELPRRACESDNFTEGLEAFLARRQPEFNAVSSTENDVMDAPLSLGADATPFNAAKGPPIDRQEGPGRLRDGGYPVVPADAVAGCSADQIAPWMPRRRGRVGADETCFKQIQLGPTVHMPLDQL